MKLVEWWCRKDGELGSHGVYVDAAVAEGWEGVKGDGWPAAEIPCPWGCGGVLTRDGAIEVGEEFRRVEGVTCCPGG